MTAAASHAMPAYVAIWFRGLTGAFGPGGLGGEVHGGAGGGAPALIDGRALDGGAVDWSKSKPHDRQKRKPPRRRVPQDGQNAASIVMAVAISRC